MALIDTLALIFAVVSVLFVAILGVVIGVHRIRTGTRNVRVNVNTTSYSVILLGIVLAANGVVRDAGIELSWLIGVNITGHIHALEGNIVPILQSVATPALTAYFSIVYVIGYTFLLTFPFVAYALLDDADPLHELITAYIVNYGVGLVCYVLFVAYGPRNFLPDLVDPLLYTYWPQSQLVTSQVNANTNVFPSLHTSLSVTVALLSYRTRKHYPLWLPIAGLLAISISISTMYLGIHWATDVVAGILLAVLSIHVADRATQNRRNNTALNIHSEDWLGGRVSTFGRWLRGN